MTLQSDIEIYNEAYERFIQECHNLQKKFCELTGIPCFVDDTMRCPYCNIDLLLRFTKDQCAREHITYCPKCRRSFAE